MTNTDTDTDTDSTTQVTLISCTSQKRDRPAPARDLYDPSPYFRKMREWANALGREWYILSAKHGLVHPDARLEPYDERGLSTDQSEDIAERLKRNGVSIVDVTAGRAYTDPLIPALEQRRIDVVEHFAGLRIGKRQQALDKAIQQLQHD